MACGRAQRAHSFAMKIKIIHLLRRVEILVSEPVNPRPISGLPTPTTEYNSTNELVVYEKGAKVRVEDMGDGHFRDVDQNGNFTLEDKSAYTIENES